MISARRLIALESKSRKPHRSPHKTKPKVEKQILKIRRVEPYLGPERITNAAEKIYDLKVPPSTVFAILKRAKVVGKKIAEKLTKKHLKRYRRPWPGYLQMDFKYVPYLIDGVQYYQLSCIDHHSSWRFIRCYPNKSTNFVIKFMNELEANCPFHIFEIQTDNDTAFTDKFTSGKGVTRDHDFDIWCNDRNIVHRLIPVGVKELNGKVENTHKQDDREFFAMNRFTTYKSIELSTRSYNERWNEVRATKALKWKTPNEVLEDATVRALAFLLYYRTDRNKAVYYLDDHGNATIPLPKTKKIDESKIKTRKNDVVKTYLNTLIGKNQKRNCISSLHTRRCLKIFQGVILLRAVNLFFNF